MPKSIMIVDDSEIIRCKVRHLVEAGEGWTVCAEAADGRDAIEKAQMFHPDLIVLDFFMPFMDGLEAAPHLKDINPNSPIVMLTAFKDRQVEEKAFKAGVSWVLSKTTDDLRKILDFACRLLATCAGSGRAMAPELAAVNAGCDEGSLEDIPPRSHRDWGIVLH